MFANGIDKLAHGVRDSVWLEGLDVLYEKVLMQKDTTAQVNLAISEAVIHVEDVLQSRLSSVLVFQLWTEAVKWLSMIQEFLKISQKLREKGIGKKISEKYLTLRSYLDCIAEALTRVDDDDAEFVQASGKEWLVQLHFCTDYIERKFPEVEVPDPCFDSTELSLE